MTLRSRRAVVLALALAVVAACGSDDESSDPVTSAPAPTTAAAGGTASGVTVEDPGAEPRQPLVLRITPGSSDKAAFLSRIGLTATADGQPLDIGTLPGFKIVLDQRADRVDPDGTVHYTVTFSDASVEATPGADPATVQQSQAGLAQMKGLRGTGSFDAQGDNHQLSFDTSAVSDPAIRSTLDSLSSQIGNLSAPLPSQPLGIGARWTARRSATINGITVNTTTTYTLRSRTGDRYELDLVQRADAPPGPTEIPNLPAGTEASIERFEVQGTGRITGDLTHQLPVSSTVKAEGDGSFIVSQGAQRGALTQHLTLDFELSPA